MAKCDFCDKSVNFGRKISITRSQVSRRALTSQKPNIRRVRAIVDGTPKTVHACARCLRDGKVSRA
ncbi:MAG: L28 family ribosomal protein [Eubacteriales bacterium]|nr:L28 family ribosomal protein [Eubacteriales bacterium]